jgi:tetratricopeptide (TPR) repeat protein
MVDFAAPNRTRLLFAGAAVVVAVAAGLMLAGELRPGSATAAISDDAVKLSVAPRTIELTSEKAMRAREAIKHDDYATAGKIVAEVLAKSTLQNWRFYPFSDFMDRIADVSDPTFAAHLDAWVAQDKNDAVPLLVRAKYDHDAGWFKRGGGFVSQTRAADMASFADYMNKAIADIDAALKLNNENPYGFYLKLRILLGSGASDRMIKAFEEAVAKYPAYYPLYDVTLTSLDPRWGGSVAMMYAFVDRYAGKAEQNSPLKLLYLSLYRDLLNAVSVACTPKWDNSDAVARCVTTGMAKLVTPALEDHVLTALQLYDHTDSYQFGLAVERILSQMLKTAGGDVYAGTVLQLAATSMHSDTQLKEAKPGNNNYIIDKAVAESWYVKGFYDNALKKDLEALSDAQAATFSSEEEKDLAVAGIYEYIGETYNKLNQYADMIAYEKAAIALGNKTEGGQLVCFGYYRLKDYDIAVQSCTQTLRDEPDNLQARYWRGSAYRDSGQTDAAVADFAAVADSEDNFRTSAAIDLSMIYFNRKDDHAALDVLNKYTYLYNPDTQSKSDMAVSYNNRCYAYMQLGDLKKALADCRASLRYGSLPDAIRKQQELISRLGPGDEEHL